MYFYDNVIMLYMWIPERMIELKIDFKSNKVKTIIIVIAAVTIAGAATIIGITVGNHNHEKIEEMINQAVSSALTSQESTSETTTEETTTESTAEESTAAEAIAKVKGRTTTTTTTTAKATEKTAVKSNGASVADNREEYNGPIKYNYKDIFYKVARFNGDLCNVYRRTGDGPDNGKYFLLHGADYWPTDEIKNQFEFVFDYQINESPQYHNDKKYYEILGNGNFYLREDGKVFEDMNTEISNFNSNMLN